MQMRSLILELLVRGERSCFSFWDSKTFLKIYANLVAKLFKRGINNHLGDYLYRTAPADNAMIDTGTFA
jgi:hypothetical protein